MWQFTCILDGSVVTQSSGRFLSDTFLSNITNRQMSLQRVFHIHPKIFHFIEEHIVHVFKEIQYLDTNSKFFKKDLSIR